MACLPSLKSGTAEAAFFRNVLKVQKLAVLCVQAKQIGLLGSLSGVLMGTVPGSLSGIGDGFKGGGGAKGILPGTLTGLGGGV